MRLLLNLFMMTIEVEFISIILNIVLIIILINTSNKYKLERKTNIGLQKKIIELRKIIDNKNINIDDMNLLQDKKIEEMTESKEIKTSEVRNSEIEISIKNSETAIDKIKNIKLDISEIKANETETNEIKTSKAEIRETKANEENSFEYQIQQKQNRIVKQVINNNLKVKPQELSKTIKAEITQDNKQTKLKQLNEENTRTTAINIVLTLGVLFIITAGLIFATTTWNTIDSVGKILVIVALVAMFYIFSFIGEKVFQLKRTGMAFYVLGCFFSVIGIIAIGYFKLFGEYFTLIGEGKNLFLSACFAIAGSSILIGYFKYKKVIFKVIFWINLLFSILFLGLTISNVEIIQAIFYLIYLVILVIAGLSKGEEGENLFPEKYIKINMLIFSIWTLSIVHNLGMTTIIIYSILLGIITFAAFKREDLFYRSVFAVVYELFIIQLCIIIFKFNISNIMIMIISFISFIGIGYIKKDNKSVLRTLALDIMLLLNCFVIGIYLWNFRITPDVSFLWEVVLCMGAVLGMLLIVVARAGKKLGFGRMAVILVTIQLDILLFAILPTDMSSQVKIFIMAIFISGVAFVIPNIKAKLDITNGSDWVQTVKLIIVNILLPFIFIIDEYIKIYINKYEHNNKNLFMFISFLITIGYILFRYIRCYKAKNKKLEIPMLMVLLTLVIYFGIFVSSEALLKGIFYMSCLIAFFILEFIEAKKERELFPSFYSKLYLVLITLGIIISSHNLEWIFIAECILIALIAGWKSYKKENISYKIIFILIYEILIYNICQYIFANEMIFLAMAIISFVSFVAIGLIKKDNRQFLRSIVSDIILFVNCYMVGSYLFINRINPNIEFLWETVICIVMAIIMTILFVKWEHKKSFKGRTAVAVIPIQLEILVLLILPREADIALKIFIVVLFNSLIAITSKQLRKRLNITSDIEKIQVVKMFIGNIVLKVVLFNSNFLYGRLFMFISYLLVAVYIFSRYISAKRENYEKKVFNIDVLKLLFYIGLIYTYGAINETIWIPADMGKTVWYSILSIILIAGFILGEIISSELMEAKSGNSIITIILNLSFFDKIFNKKDKIEGIYISNFTMVLLNIIVSTRTIDIINYMRVDNRINIIFGIWLMILCYLAFAMTYRKKISILSAVPVILTYKIVTEIIGSVPSSFNVVNLLLAVIHLILGRILFRELVKDKKFINIDIMSLSLNVAAINIMLFSPNGENIFYLFLIEALFLLGLKNKIKNKNIENVILSLGGFMVVLVLNTQSLIVLPDIVEAEFFAVCMVMLGFWLQFVIWKNSKRKTYYIPYVISICMIIMLVSNAIYTELLFDALFLGIVGIIILSAGFLLQKKMWIKLGAILDIILILYITKEFWTSLEWGAYLLIAGILLIVLAAVREKKRKGDNKDNVEEKNSR